MSDEARTINSSRLALARRRRGMSMTRLADLIGVQPRRISAFEKGEFSPSDETLVRLARTLRFPVEFFFGSRSGTFRMDVRLSPDKESYSPVGIKRCACILVGRGHEATRCVLVLAKRHSIHVSEY